MFEQDYDLDLPSLKPVGGFLAGVLVGGLIGAAAMLLFAPQSGAKTRKQLRRKAEQLRENVGDTYDETVDMARERAEQVKSGVRDRLDEVQQRGHVMLEEQKHKVESVVQAGRDAVKRR